MPTAEAARRRDASGTAAAATRKGTRDEFTAYIGNVLVHLQTHYAADRWDILMYVVTYVLVIALFASGLFADPPPSLLL